MRGNLAADRNKLIWWPPAVIVGAACLFCWPVFAGRIMLPADMCLLMLPWNELRPQFPDFYRPHNPMFDPIQQYLPWRIYAVESLRDGFVPLWNPYAFCGTPFLANLQSTVLYPLNLLFLVAGARYGFGISAIVHLSLGGLLMYAFLRTLSLRPAASLFGALVLMFNGFTVSWLEFPTLSLWVFMWLPGLLLCYERALRSPRSVWPVLCALAAGAQFLGGHLQISVYVAIAFLLYAVVRMVASRSDRRLTITAAGFAGTSLAAGLAVASAQLLPTLELAHHTGRVAAGGAAAVRTAFPLTHFILYLVPNFFGNPVNYNYWGHYRDPSALNFFETACYVGVLPLFLAALSLRRWRRPELWFFLALTLFAALAAIGSPVYMLLYYIAPGFRELAGLGRVLCLAAFGLAGLSAVGFDHLLGRTRPGRLGLPLVCGIVAAGTVGGATAAFAPLRQALAVEWHFEEYFRLQVAVALALVASASVLLALRARLRIGSSVFASAAVILLAADLFGLGLGFNPFVDPEMAYPETQSITWIQNHIAHARFGSLKSNGLDWMAHNSPMIFGLRDIHGSDSLRVRPSFELVSGPRVDQSDYPQPDSPLWDVLGVRYLMTRRELTEPWERVHDGASPVYVNPEAMPRAYRVSRYVVADDKAALTGLEEGPARLRREAILADPPAQAFPDAVGIRPAGADVAFRRDAPNEVILETAGESPCLLVLTDSYYPGWRAWVYESPVPIYRANYAFRAVAVPSGKQLVTLRYEPASFRVGLFISLLALSLLAAWATTSYLAAPGRTSSTAERS